MASLMLTKEILDQLIERVVYEGEPAKTVGREVGLSGDYGRKVILAWRALHRNDIDKLKQMWLAGFARGPIAFIADYSGIPFPEELDDFIESQKKKNAPSESVKAKPTDERYDAPQLPDQVPFYIQHMLLNQAKMIELFEQLMDAVLPKYVEEINKTRSENIAQLSGKMRCEFDSAKLMIGDCVRNLNSIKDNVKKKR